MTTAKGLVYFRDLLENESPPHYGILFENGFILCLCCGGYVEPKDYEIIQDFGGFAYLDDTLKAHF